MVNLREKFSGERYINAYIGVNSIAGGNRTGYPCAADAFAVVVKGLPWENGIGNEELLEIGHKEQEKVVDKWGKSTGLPTKNL